MLEHERSRDDVSHVPTTQADSSTEAKQKMLRVLAAVREHSHLLVVFL